MTIGQAPLKGLHNLSLLCSALATPKSRVWCITCKRWSQTRKLTIHMRSFGHEPGKPTDHLKLLHAYIGSFPAVKRIDFHWEGERGLSPLSLATEPRLEHARTGKPSQACPHKSASRVRPLRFPHLLQMELVNATRDASQVTSFIPERRHSLREFNFEDVVLRSGNWDDALAPLTRLSGSEEWMQGQRNRESVDVPIVLSAGLGRKHLQKAICTLQQRKGPSTLRSLAGARSRTRELWGRSPDHMKRLLRPSVFSWR
ncbi:hypothetical protein N7457_007504 [Penicillium paradoxum]|uniref:uncharacterized protein n=1 Tax=Penicillium paradoxum TaxID=176176 RepID=UPI0025477798|nr:uncharacterized protein N7457_007504 [Penicillium paradoxum]KAJ5779784.1 hypothetical protein N7457_007504 [Penicillium paradoxum]